MRNAPQTIAEKMNSNIVFALDNKMDINPRWFYTMLECVCEAESISFESEYAQSNFFTVVQKWMDKKLHREVFSPETVHLIEDIND